jgi:hypothetical protein
MFVERVMDTPSTASNTQNYSQELRVALFVGPNWVGFVCNFSLRMGTDYVPGTQHFSKFYYYFKM